MIFCFSGKAREASNLRPRSVLLSSSLLKKCQPAVEWGIFSNSWDTSVIIYHHAYLMEDLRKDFMYLCSGKYQVESTMGFF